MKLRFSIRDILWLALVVALAVGWWLERRSLQVDLNRSQRKIESLNMALADEMRVREPSIVRDLQQEVQELRQQLKIPTEK